MRTSETTADLSAAISKAQAELKNPPKNRVNPHFKSKYADLAAILETVLPVYAAHGVSIMQAPSMTDTGIVIVTRFMKGNEWIEGTYPVCNFATPQQQMAALTYAKRAALQAMGMVCGDDDLDGEDSKDVTTNVAPKRVPTPPKPPSDAFDLETSQVTRDTLIEAMSMARTEAELRKWSADNTAVIGKLLEADKQAVRDVYGDTLQALKSKAA